jgi:hypothetical protein
LNIINKVEAHILSQKELCCVVNDTTRLGKYQTILEDGRLLKCAIGYFIPEKEYSYDLEDSGKGLCNLFTKVYLEKADPVYNMLANICRNSEILSRFQYNLHDKFLYQELLDLPGLVSEECNFVRNYIGKEDFDSISDLKISREMFNKYEAGFIYKKAYDKAIYNKFSDDYAKAYALAYHNYSRNVFHGAQKGIFENLIEDGYSAKYADCFVDIYFETQAFIKKSKEEEFSFLQKEKILDGSIRNL